MKQNQKQLIESAKVLENKMMKFSSIYIINSEKEYNGFWGKNDFRRIIVLGKDKENNELYNISGNYQVDDLKIENKYGLSIHCEISTEDDCVHLWLYGGYIQRESEHDVSSLVLNIIKEN